MRIAEFVRGLKKDPDYRGQIEFSKVLDASPPRFAEPKTPLDPRLGAALESRGIRKLYTHQAEAVDRVREGFHVITVTATASGKTLCYNIPVVEAALNDTRARALYLFPTKALAQDQLSKLNELGFFPQVRFATYDGDTPKSERPPIRRGAHIVLTNPDMLHVGILPYHTNWAQFLTSLRYVVVDEIHTYRGVFGAHVAQILRRLRRVCALYGAKPQFIASSATIANPGELMHRLTGLDASVVDDDGSPHGRRTFLFWNPPLVGTSGTRRSTHSESTALFTGLVSNRIRNITFTKARKSAELILRYARDRFEKDAPELCGRITGYRAGYMPEERRRIERGLTDGEILGAVSTNALELGVDIGGIEATVLTGYPGTVASTWQQAGRSGRNGEESLSVLVALDGPLDQYLMRHPEYILGRVRENAIVNPANARILRSHLACAAYESPIGLADLELFTGDVAAILDSCGADGILTHRNDRWYFRGEGYPAADVNIRSVSSVSYEIRDQADPEFVLGTIDGARAYQTVHPGAIYLQQGESYLVKELDEEGLVAWVRQEDAGYYTEPREVTFTSILGERTGQLLGDCRLSFGEVVVTSHVVGYRTKQLYSDVVLDMADLDLPDQVFETEALWITLPAAMAADLVEKGFDLCGAIHAAEHAMIGMMPLFSTCDRWDLGGLSTPHHPDTGGATIFVYDGYPGGVGIAEATYERLHGLFEVTRELIDSCPCTDGCPACVQSPKCGNNNDPLDKQGAGYLLAAILNRQ